LQCYIKLKLGPQSDAGSVPESSGLNSGDMSDAAASVLSYFIYPGNSLNLLKREKRKEKRANQKERMKEILIENIIQISKKNI